MDRIDEFANVIDSRDVIYRVRQLQALRAPGPVPEGVLEEDDYETDQDTLFAELSELESLEDAASSAPDWDYGAQLIRDSYFVEYAQQLAEDIGSVSRDGEWPCSYIDWERAADALKIDYFDVEFRGVTYWIRA